MLRCLRGGQGSYRSYGKMRFNHIRMVLLKPFFCFFVKLDQIAEKRKKLKKDGRADESIPEDDAEKYKRSIYVMVMKVSVLCIALDDFFSLFLNCIFVRN